MQDDYLLRQEDLAENPTTRVPVCLVLDVSGSMDGAPIAELQAGVKMFLTLSVTMKWRNTLRRSAS